ncbi:diguanylate cyclase [Sphingomonas sp.]|uniref:GGDEF domain-containing protein n=1 Tax=Sphingomonas sp. TaxID=28214 RepID=UPI003B3A82CB
MRYDPISSDARVRCRGWLRFLFGQEEGPPVPLPPPPDPLLVGSAEFVDLAVLAAQLAELIGSARERLDGAVAMVDRSANDAADYGKALSREAEAIGAQELPADTVAALLNVTRAMIDRTESAEERLRSTNAELRALQRDLSIAQESAERDPLTGLLNRGALQRALVRAIETARQTEAALSVAFCDIDDFKRLNDIHGHAVGDRVLRLVADALAEEADDNTFVGRQGGEEFVLLFEGSGVLEAAARVDAVREALSRRFLRSRSDGAPIGHVTFSAGVAGLAQGEGEEEVLDRADRALYRAKQGGRNQVMIDTPD